MNGFERDLRDLATALESCTTLNTPAGREDCVAQLPEQIRGMVVRRDDTKGDLLSIVRACSQHKGGIENLLDAVNYKESDSAPMQLVKERAAVLIQKLKEVRTSGSDPTTPAGGGVSAATEQRHALVIGINEYKYGRLPGQELKAHEFTKLKFAADDAREFAAFLQKDNRFTVDLLVNENAGFKEIMQALENLRRRCNQSDNPLVLLFFSGHGVRDDADRHYLVPHDGQRDHLFSTALWSKLFDAVLKQLKTERLVVFLDTCHAGAIGNPDVKDTAHMECDPQSLIENEANRYVVASCRAGQQSREQDGHGIFTNHLLELLQFRTNDFANKEQVDLWDLWDVLKRKVKQTVSDRFDGALQEPWANLNARTGVILAINEDFKNARRQKERKFLSALEEALTALASNKKVTIRLKLEEFIEYDQREDAPADFYHYFRECAESFKTNDKARVARMCERLLRLEDSAGVDSAVQIPEGTEQLPSYASHKKLDPGRIGASPSSRPSQQQQSERRGFSPVDCDTVLKPIWSPTYYGEFGELQNLLKRPEGVNDREIMTWLRDKEPPDADGKEAWKEVAKLFAEKWKAAKEKVVQPQNALNIRMGRGMTNG